MRRDDPYAAEMMQRGVLRVEAESGMDAVQGRRATEQALLMAASAGERFLGPGSREDLGEALSARSFNARGRTTGTAEAA